MPDTAHRLGNLRLLWRPRRDLTLNLRYRYVGRRGREPTDPRADLPGYDRIDLTATAFRLLKDLTLRAGVRNLLDADVRYPAPAGTYPEDYPAPGRQWWLQMEYHF